MPSKGKAKKRAFKYARSKEDVAQNTLLNNLDKRVSNMEQSVERKYSYVQVNRDAIQPWDPTSQIGRQVNITQVRIGTTQGTQDFNQRVGDTVSVKSIDFRYNVGVEGSASGNPAQANNRIRVMMFWDTEPVQTSTAGVNVVNMMMSTRSVHWKALTVGPVPRPTAQRCINHTKSERNYDM